MNKKATNEEFKKAVNKGYTAEELANKFGYALCTVYNKAQKMNLRLKPPSEKPLPKKIREYNLVKGVVLKIDRDIKTVIEVYENSFLCVNLKGVRESYQRKEFEYNLINFEIVSGVDEQAGENIIESLKYKIDSICWLISEKENEGNLFKLKIADKMLDRLQNELL